MSPSEYVIEIVAPTFMEFKHERRSRRRAYLACVMVFQIKDYLKRAGETGIEQRMRQSTGGFRVIVVYRTSTRTVFVDGFAKSDQDNINDDDLARFRELAVEFFGHTAKTVQALVEAGAWIEVECDD